MKGTQVSSENREGGEKTRREEKNMLGFHHGNFTIAALQFIYCPQNNFHLFRSSHSKQGKNVLITME